MAKTSVRAANFGLLEPFWAEKIVRKVLPNGLTLLIKPDSFAPVASVQVWVKTGSMHEDKLLGAGVSHFLEHMLFKGTTRRAGREISATVQAHGGYINAYTTFDRTVYYIDLPSEHVSVALDILSDAVLHSTLPADEVVKERDVILREIDMGRDDPDNRLSETLFETAFRQHPFRHPIIGHREVFSAVTHEDLSAYYKTRYVPNNLVVVVAGDVDEEKIVAEVTRLFGSESRKRLAPVLISAEPAQLAPRSVHSFEDVEVSRAGLAWPVPGITHPDAPILDLLATILGSGDSSVLWQAIREKAELVHTIDAHAWTPGEAGLFFISYNSDAAKREKAAAAIQREIGRAARIGFSHTQIQKALQQMIVGEINSRKTVSGQAARIGAAEVVVGDLDYLRAYFAALKKITNSDLRRVINAYLVPQKLTSVSLNPKGPEKSSAKPTAHAAGKSAQFEEVRLANGARIVWQADHHLPNVHIRFLCKGGPLMEDPRHRGTTGLLATMLTKDTKKRSSEEVAAYIESVGGALYPFSGNNSFGLAGEVIPTELDRLITLLTEAVLTPKFAQATFDREQEAQVADLRQDLDDPAVLGRKLVRKKFFGAYPLFLDAAGDPESVEKLTVREVADQWKRCLSPENIVVSIAGDFDSKRVLPQLKALLSKLPKVAAERPRFDFSKPAEVGDFSELVAREQAVVFEAFPAPGILQPDFYVGEVADELFSGMSSRLFERVREEKGLAYYVRSSRVIGLEAAMFMFFAGTSPQQYREVFQEIDAEIERVQSGGVSAEELQRCQVRLKAARRMGLQTNSARAMQAGLNALYGLPVNDWQNYDRYIDEVTLERLQAFAQKFFRRELRTQLVVTPKI